jgi:hypothetical protein
LVLSFYCVSAGLSGLIKRHIGVSECINVIRQIVLKVSSGTGKFDYAQVNEVVGVAMGMWVGAFIIPLDWERPYQVLF